jgi:hypothetical protein
MSHNLVGAPGDLPAKWTIDFKLRASLSRPIQQPMIIDDPVGLAAFGDSSIIFFAWVTDPGAGVYTPMPNIKATTYIHGWTVSSGWIYVLDGVELIAYDLRTGNKAATLALLSGADAQAANDALAKLQKAQQKFEWATLLELAEDEWGRVTAEQAAAPLGSAKRDELDVVATDFFRMLKELREITGSAGGGVAARQLVNDLRKALATERTAAAPWCFAAPVVRRRSFEEPMRALFTVRGNGTLYAVDKSVKTFVPSSTKGHAELRLILIEELSSSLRLLAYVSNGTLQVADAKTFADVGSWTPETKPGNGTTHSLSAVKGQIWWGTDAAVYSLKVDDTGKLTPAWKSGVPWITRQVGRLNAPVTTYNPPVDPNELFDTMNVPAWIDQPANKTAPLTDGQMSLLMLSDDAGKYTSPRAGTSYVVHGPFERDAGSSESRWSQAKPHHSGSMMLLSDQRGAISFCRYPLPASGWQLVPQWSVSPSLLSSITRYSAVDLALSEGWPTPARRIFAEDMVARLRARNINTFNTVEAHLRSYNRGVLDELLLRGMVWHHIVSTDPPDYHINLCYMERRFITDALFTATEQQELKTRFGRPGAEWAMFAAAEYKNNLNAKPACPVNFDPPFINTSVPPNLFHSRPPLWYDPWGYNRPGDFINEQPSKTYLDPFCFEGQLRLPHRRINFDTAFKVRTWAVFTDNDPSTILRTVKPPPADGTPAPEPAPLRAAGDPNVLVVTADEDRQRSTLRVLPSRLSRITFDTASHTLRNEAKEVGSIESQVLTMPVVYLNPGSPAGAAPTAWCVTAPNFPSARLRALAKTDNDGVSPWDKFVDEKSSQCAASGTRTWKLDTCPLPTSVLPSIVVLGFGVPAL